jgi:parallel beta-helix repeat protein
MSKYLIILGVLFLCIGCSMGSSTYLRIKNVTYPSFSERDIGFQDKICENICSHWRSNISGLYYLRDDNPGSPSHDWGSLLRAKPIENESTFCDRWIMFSFAENGTYVGMNRIFNIYYHFWQKSYGDNNSIYNIGYTTMGYDGNTPRMNESLLINTNNYITLVDGFRLIQGLEVTNPEIGCFEGDEIYNFATVLTAGNWPWMRNNPNQYSFLIFNLEDNSTLQTLDRDADHLTDYDELFVYYTNPFECDTDNDGGTDFEEVSGGLHGFCNSNPNDPGNTTLYRCVVYVDAGGPYYDNADQEIQFFGSVTGGSTPYRWCWEFGDGESSPLQNPLHHYMRAGTYTVTLTVADATGTSDWDTTTTLVLGVHNLNKNTYYRTIQEAVNAADLNDTISVFPGTYHEHIIINKQLTLSGDERKTTIIDGDSIGDVVIIKTNNSILRGFTIQNSSHNSAYAAVKLVPHTMSNTITDNILKNSGCGLCFYSSNANIITGNILMGNINGIRSMGANNNHLYHNTLISNTQPAYDTGNNIWDDDHTAGGNYWDVYAGLDGNYDGIGDTGFIILGGHNQDRYPLMYRFLLGDMNHDGVVNTLDVDPFIMALTNPVNYQSQYHLLPLIHGDINYDGLVNVFDIDSFITLLAC